MTLGDPIIYRFKNEIGIEVTLENELEVVFKMPLRTADSKLKTPVFNCIFRNLWSPMWLRGVNIRQGILNNQAGNN